MSKCLDDNIIIAGRLKYFASTWETITSDAWILDCISHCHIDFTEIPFQAVIPQPIRFSESESLIVEESVKTLLDKGAIKRAHPGNGEFVSNIFLRPKKDGSIRPIINLKQLNKFVKYFHFKMETFEYALTLIRQDCFLASIDLKDAYFTIPIADEHQKYLCFQWRGELWQFTCLCFGLASAPRIFTKVMKPIVATLRNMGHISANYIDDSLLIGDSKDECSKNVEARCSLLESLGFVINEKKSHKHPAQVLEFLGFVINTIEMSVRLPARKASAVVEACTHLLNQQHPTIHLVAQVIGKLISCFPAVPLGPLYYRSLEMAKDEALKANDGNFSCRMDLPRQSIPDLQWWIENVSTSFRKIYAPVHDVQIQTDASPSGWGAICLSMSDLCTHGGWTSEELEMHINCLELSAVFYALKAFLPHLEGKVVLVQLDNTAAESYINHMGGCKSKDLNDLARKLWAWCLQHDIWITAAHIPGKLNTDADYLSRSFNENLEWKLNEHVFQRVLLKLDIQPTIDMFASRINFQFRPFVSWHPDPEASSCDAFTISWANEIAYCFPPFALIDRVLQKLEREQTTIVLIFPHWTAQTWFPRLLRVLVSAPVILPSGSDVLYLPQEPHRQHPLRGRLALCAGLLSGNPSAQEDFHAELSTLSSRRGSQVQGSSTAQQLPSGYTSVLNDLLIQFRHL